MDHMTVREQLKELPWLVKVAYYAGMFKLIPKYSRDYKTGKWKYGNKLRLLHPLNWVLLLILLVIHGFNQETFSDLKDEVVWW